MDPISAGLGIVGTGIQIWAGFEGAANSRHMADVSKQIAGDEQQINAQKNQQMQLEARRMQMEQFRNSQRLRAQATAAAVNQGAQSGTGLQGGLSQITGQQNTNLVGINQNLQIGNNIFGLNNDISSKKMQMADLQAQGAEYQAWGSLGGALVKNSGTIGGLGQDAYSAGSKAMSLWSPGSLSGGQY